MCCSVVNFCFWIIGYVYNFMYCIWLGTFSVFFRVHCLLLLFDLGNCILIYARSFCYLSLGQLVV